MGSSLKNPITHQRPTASRSGARPLNDMGRVLAAFNSILQQPSTRHMAVSLRRRLRQTTPGPMPPPTPYPPVPLLAPTQTLTTAAFQPTLSIFEGAQPRHQETQAEQTDSEELLLVEGLPDLVSELRILNHKLDMHNTEHDKRPLLQKLPLLRAAMGLQPADYDVNDDSSAFSNNYLSSPATSYFGGSDASKSPSPIDRAASDRKDFVSRLSRSVRPEAQGCNNDLSNKRGGLTSRRSSDVETSSDGGVTLYPPSIGSSEVSVSRRPLRRSRSSKAKVKQRYKNATASTASEPSI